MTLKLAKSLTNQLDQNNNNEIKGGLNPPSYISDLIQRLITCYASGTRIYYIIKYKVYSFFNKKARKNMAGLAALGAFAKQLGTQLASQSATSVINPKEGEQSISIKS